MRRNFRAPWDGKLIGITCILVVLLGSLLPTYPGPVGTGIILAAILGGAAFGVYGYSIRDKKLKIIRLGWSKDIDLDNINKVKIEPNAMKGSARVFGIGGLFGYIGIFSNKILGRYKAYATHSEKTVVIETEEKTYVISPDDLEAFKKSLEGRMN